MRKDTDPKLEYSNKNQAEEVNPLGHRVEPSKALHFVLKTIKPLIRFLIRHGVTYPQFSQSLKDVFLNEGRQLLSGKVTDSSLSVISGIHRRDIRQIREAETQARTNLSITHDKDSVETGFKAKFGLAAQVYARWLSDVRFLDASDRPLPLVRTSSKAAVSFEMLVTSISTDVRPKAVADQLARMGLITESNDELVINANGFSPRADWQALSGAASENLSDHLGAALGNLEGRNFLEQAVFSDEMSAQSVDELHLAAAKNWRDSHRALMRLAQELYDRDMANLPAEQRRYRARVGMYFFQAEEDKPNA